MITPSFGLTATERVLPKLALDFTTASLDPRVTFTRTTGAANPATYVDSGGLIASAVNDQPRFDFNPTTLVCKGLLIEESRTNNLSPSSDFSGYILSNTAVVLSAATSPDGTTNANKINETAVSGTHFIRKDITLANAAYSASIYAKAGERTAFAIQMSDGVAGGAAWKFDLTNGVSTQDTGVSAGSWTNISGSITNAGNGWYRCTVTATKGAGTAVSTRVFTLSSYASSVVSSYLGVAGSGIYAYGLQLEAGAFATSYIPTTTTALTRNADVATMTGTNFSDWYNASEGTFEVQSTVGASGATVINVNDGGTSNFMLFSANGSFGGGARTFAIRTATVYQTTFNAATVSTQTVTQWCGAYKENNCANSVNAVSTVTDTLVSLPTVNQVYIGGFTSPTLNGHMMKIMYWPQRLTNNEVQAFSKG